MKVGIPKEKKVGEYRVAATPRQTQEIIESGHTVLVEKDAGLASGFLNEDYQKSGAIICNRDQVFDCDFILKIKCPHPEEYPLLKENQMLFCYLHFDENIPPENIQKIVDSGVIGIAYEWVEENGTFPLLEPMSRISGALFARKALDLLLLNKGHLGGDYLTEVKPARAMIIGIGRQGAAASSVLARNGIRLVIVDKKPERINHRIKEHWPDWDADNCLDRVIEFDEDSPETSLQQIREELPKIDIVLGCAIRRSTLPKEKLRYILDRQSIRLMKPRSILCDTTACNADLYETSFSSEDLHATYTDEGVVHYSCDHIPSLAPRISTELLTARSFPFTKKLLQGFEKTAQRFESVRKATMCYKKELTHQYSAHIKNMKYKDLTKLLTK